MSDPGYQERLVELWCGSCGRRLGLVRWWKAKFLEVPVSVQTPPGRADHQQIKATPFRDPQRRPRRLGPASWRAANAADDLVTLGRQRYPEIPAYFGSIGFALLLPTRIGHGELGCFEGRRVGRVRTGTFRWRSRLQPINPANNKIQ